MILDQLIEKKDLLAYIKYRSETLDRAAQRAVQTLPPKKRERARRTLVARQHELDHLRVVIEQGNLKREGKFHYMLKMSEEKSTNTP